MTTQTVYQASNSRLFYKTNRVCSLDYYTYVVFLDDPKKTEHMVFNEDVPAVGSLTNGKLTIFPRTNN